ncbi:MAG TPA: hypothetical protein VJ551_01440 [Nitrososphaeraceae archaeon]|nr:hypothetical protein [Nitrososphaeraceae archaeon]
MSNLRRRITIELINIKKVDVKVGVVYLKNSKNGGRPRRTAFRILSID